MEEKSMYSTRDLNLAATLVTSKFLMEGIDLQYEGGKPKPVGFFRFAQTPELIDVKRKYDQGLLLVEPKTFQTNLRGLKAEIESIFGQQGR
jgi:hypothetical protein